MVFCLPLFQVHKLIHFPCLQKQVIILECYLKLLQHLINLPKSGSSHTCTTSLLSLVGTIQLSKLIVQLKSFPVFAWCGAYFEHAQAKPYYK